MKIEFVTKSGSECVPRPVFAGGQLGMDLPTDAMLENRPQWYYCPPASALALAGHRADQYQGDAPAEPTDAEIEYFLRASGVELASALGFDD